MARKFKASIVIPKKADGELVLTMALRNWADLLAELKEARAFVCDPEEMNFLAIAVDDLINRLNDV